MTSVEEKKELFPNCNFLINNINDAVIILDLKGNIIRINEPLLKLGGYEREEIEGKMATELIKVFPPKSLAKITKSFLDAARGVPSDRYELEARTKSGEKKIIEVSNSLVKESGVGKFVVVVARDVTEMKNKVNLIEREGIKYKEI